MKTAFLADLHANREAVESVMEHADLQGAEAWVLLGDFVGYGADPGWVVDVVRDLVRNQGAFAVMGNHDQAVVRGVSAGMRPDPAKVIGWTRERLSAEQIDFLADLPLVQTHGNHLFVHANAWAPDQWEYVVGRNEAARSMNATDRHVTFCGHVHEPRLYNLSATGKSGDFSPTPGMPIPLMPQRQWLAIAGSVGQPRDGNPAACYAIFDDADGSLTFHRVPYDHETAGAKILQAELPQRLAFRLEEGE